MALLYIYIYLSVLRWPILFSLQVITRFPQFTKYLVCKLELFRDRIALCQRTKDSFSSLFNNTHKIHRLLDLLSPLDNFTIQECTELFFLNSKPKPQKRTLKLLFENILKVLLLERQSRANVSCNWASDTPILLPRQQSHKRRQTVPRSVVYKGTVIFPASQWSFSRGNLETSLHK